jgi:hypothetical protein
MSSPGSKRNKRLRADDDEQDNGKDQPAETILERTVELLTRLMWTFVPGALRGSIREEQQIQRELKAQNELLETKNARLRKEALALDPTEPPQYNFQKPTLFPYGWHLDDPETPAETRTRVVCSNTNPIGYGFQLYYPPEMFPEWQSSIEWQLQRKFDYENDIILCIGVSKANGPCDGRPSEETAPMHAEVKLRIHKLHVAWLREELKRTKAAAEGTDEAKDALSLAELKAHAAQTKLWIESIQRQVAGRNFDQAHCLAPLELEHISTNAEVQAHEELISAEAHSSTATPITAPVTAAPDSVSLDIKDLFQALFNTGDDLLSGIGNDYFALRDKTFGSEPYGHVMNEPLGMFSTLWYSGKFSFETCFHYLILGRSRAVLGVGDRPTKIRHPARDLDPTDTSMSAGMVDELMVVKKKVLKWVLRNCGFSEGFHTALGCMRYLTQLRLYAPHFYQGAYSTFKSHLDVYKLDGLVVPTPMAFRDGEFVDWHD